MDLHREQLTQITRRHLLRECGVGLGAMALAGLLGEQAAAAGSKSAGQANPLAPRLSMHPARAKRVIFLQMAGGPSQIDLFDPKPKLRDLSGQTPPKEMIEGKRFAFLKPDAKLLGSPRTFARHGKSGAEISDLLPHLAGIADEICLLRGMATDVFNHGPAKLFMQTGSPQPGRPAMGAWLTYGLGSESRDLPGYVVLQSGPRGPRGGTALWSSGFLPTTYQGVPFLPGAEPILDLGSPPGFDRRRQRAFFDTVRDLNTARLDVTGDPEIATRIAAYEMAARMQASAPELVDLSKEDPKTLAMYGVELGKPSYAANCLLARRLIERGVRFVQLWHTDWDHHGGPGADLETSLPKICREVDQPSVALVRDLKQRGLLEDTLVVWGGEFGRSPDNGVRSGTKYGRDHNPRGMTLWLAGGGVKAGHTVGATDETGDTAVECVHHVRDLHVTLLHLLGLDDNRLTYYHGGRFKQLSQFGGQVIQELLG